MSEGFLSRGFAVVARKVRFTRFYGDQKHSG